jgi:endogenous inhibitor of DNA gyrase (YacG/DUF329 family)
MKKIIGMAVATTITLFTACGSPQEVKNETPKMTVENNTEKTYPLNLVNNKKDPTCGMPVTAVIHDTAHYGKWVLGFCSKECKEDAIAGLAKNSKTVLAAAEINTPATQK